MGSAATRMGYGVKVSEFIMHKFRGGLIRRKNHALPSFRLVERMLYGIGAQKAGTTWLYEQMKSHPQVGTSIFDRFCSRVALTAGGGGARDDISCRLGAPPRY